MERDYGDLDFPAVSGRTPLTRLVDSAIGRTLPYSDRVEVKQDDLRLLLGAFFMGVSPWDAPPGYVLDLTTMAHELLAQVPPGRRITVDAPSLAIIGAPQERS